MEGVWVGTQAPVVGIGTSHAKIIGEHFSKNYDLISDLIYQSFFISNFLVLDFLRRDGITFLSCLTDNLI